MRIGRVGSLLTLFLRPARGEGDLAGVGGGGEECGRGGVYFEELSDGACGAPFVYD